jgi:hypothetical protein
LIINFDWLLILIDYLSHYLINKDKMPTCYRDTRKHYTGKEKSPKGFGKCPHTRKIGTIELGKNKKKWIITEDEDHIKRWIPLKSKKKTRLTKENKKKIYKEKYFHLKNKTLSGDHYYNIEICFPYDDKEKGDNLNKMLLKLVKKNGGSTLISSHKTKKGLIFKNIYKCDNFNINKQNILNLVKSVNHPYQIDFIKKIEKKDKKHYRRIFGSIYNNLISTDNLTKFEKKIISKIH